MQSNKFSNALEIYMQEFLDSPYTIHEYKVNFLKNHFYFLVEKYIDVTRDNLLIGTTSNKVFLYFRSKLNTDIHFVYNINNPNYNYLKFDYPTKFVEQLYFDELHYKKYINNNSDNNSDNNSHNNSDNNFNKKKLILNCCIIN